MPRYLIQRTFSAGLNIPVDEAGAEPRTAVIDKNSQHGVSYSHSYVTPDKTKTFCIYDAPARRPSEKAP